MEFIKTLDTALAKVKICEINFNNITTYSLIDEDKTTFKFIGIPVGFDLYDCFMGKEPNKLSSGTLTKDNLSKSLINELQINKIGFGINGNFTFITRMALESLYYLVGNIKGAIIFKQPSLNREVYLSNILLDKSLTAIIINNERPIIVDFMKKKPMSSKSFFIDSYNTFKSLRFEKYEISTINNISNKLIFSPINNLIPIIEIIDNISGQMPLEIKLFAEYKGFKIIFKTFRASNNEEYQMIIKNALLEFGNFLAFIRRISTCNITPDVKLFKKNYEKLYEKIKNIRLPINIFDFLNILSKYSDMYHNFDVSDILSNIFLGFK